MKRAAVAVVTVTPNQLLEQTVKSGLRPLSLAAQRQR
jgi:hypothetical protein